MKESQLRLHEYLWFMLGSELFTNPQKLVSNFVCRGLFLERRSRVLNNFARVEIQNRLRTAGIGEIYDPFQLWHLIIQTILKKIKMTMLWNREKRNHSAKSGNRCLNSHPNYQNLGTWWWVQSQIWGPLEQAGPLGIHPQHWPRSHQFCFLPLGICRTSRWWWGEGVGLRGVMLRISVKAAVR